ncbi:MAG TPA: UTP--glucose-1-phosphate uridylyltransferase GalU [Firmicutes bacterium]|jgi:UTP--glucose-1-phosphate uridylyltransferase|nr:UTP--glucose-1-phosphate uridylyltransferase GalU [Bacillota bacterium]
MSRIRKAVIPAAGLGTRFLPATKAVPKEMLPIVDKPTIQYIVEEAVASGIEQILIITGRGKDALGNHFDTSVELEAHLSARGQKGRLEEVQAITNLADVFYVRQHEAKGLGHAILCAKAFVGDEPFAVLLGDDVVYNPEYPCLKQLIDVHAKTGASVLGVQQVPARDVRKYGIIGGQEVEDRLYKVSDLVEKPAPEEAPTNVAILGRYIISPEIFPILARTEPGVGGEIQLTDALRTLMHVEPMYALDFVGRRYDVGDKLGFLQATVELALKRPDLNGPFREYLKELVRSEEGPACGL